MGNHTGIEFDSELGLTGGRPIAAPGEPAEQAPHPTVFWTSSDRHEPMFRTETS